MAKIKEVKQSWKVFEYNDKSGEIPDVGEMYCIENSPYFGARIIFVGPGDGVKTIDQLLSEASVYLTQDQADALAGTSGTTPSGTNPFVDSADPRLNSVGEPVGNVVHTMINETEFPNRRYLPLDGNVVQIAGLYQNLFNLVYPGDTAQPTAQAFYKCDADGTRNSSGLYFKLPNANGRIIRGTGQGDFIKDKDGVDTTDRYEGGNIGDSVNDAIRNIAGHVGYPFVSNLTQPSDPFYSTGTINVSAPSGSPEHWNVFMDVSRSVPTATWNRDASISARICIVY